MSVSADGNLVINPFNPNARMQQWVVTERCIQNLHNSKVVLEVRSSENGAEATSCCNITTGENTGSDVQLWNISHTYVDVLHPHVAPLWTPELYELAVSISLQMS